MEVRSWLAAIGTLSAAVNAEHDLKSLLDLAAATAKDLLNLSFCAVMLPDQDQESLEVAGSSGLPDHYIARVNRDHPIRLEVDALKGAPASRAFRSGKPSMVRDVAAEPSAGWTELALRQGYQSILVVPLLTGSGVVGTLNSYRVIPHDFSPQEVEQLALLAEHATIALTSARMLDDLRDKHQLIVRSEEIHNRLLSVAVRSGGVAGIAKALNDLFGCDVVIEDPYGTTLAAEPLGSVHARLSEETLESSTGSSGLVREEGPHVAADVVLDGTKVAKVWLLDLAGKLDPLGIRAAEHASVVLSLELLRQRTAAEVEERLRGELLADLLGGADPDSPSIRDRASLMDHNLALVHQILVASARDTSRTHTGSRASFTGVEIAQRAATEAARMTSHLRPRPLIAAVREFVVALWPADQAGLAGEQLLRRAFASLRREVTTAVAVAAVDENGIPSAYRVARGALRFANADGEGRTVVGLDDLGAAGLLLQFADPEELRRYAERTVGAVMRYDADHSAELFKTLRTYLDFDLDRSATGERLVLHPNTVSQRLRRIQTLTGLDLRSPRSILEARTAIMLVDVANAVSVSGP